MDIYYARFTNTGNLISSGGFGGSKADNVRAINPTDDGGAIIFGDTTSTDIGIEPNDYTTKAMAAKIGPNGKMDWITGFNVDRLTEVRGAVKLKDDEHIVFGSINNDSNTRGMFLTKFKLTDKINTPPKAGVIHSQEVLLGENLTLDLQEYFNDAENDKLSYTATSSEGSTVNIEEGTLTFNSSLAGNHTVTVKANDGELDSEELTFTINVVEVNEPPVIKANIEDQVISEGQTLVLYAKEYFEDPDTTNLEYTVTTSDKYDSNVWVTTNGEIKFRSAYKGEYYVTIRATDGQSTTEPITFKVTVTEAKTNEGM
ncbi:Uncharacterised protein [Lysinibacillus capsici]|uniref:Dystroglycan-type cadherin-like domain-containing protein n=1 Tax=Lysinibacillus capsici TaxID=2115968 RepID=A0A2X1A603_9BACI|nr:Ig-like domain-containing protein [Lysinibacillus capsici]SPU40578.1 Uncharacterised protein [Lysinibacillus capsici]